MHQIAIKKNTRHADILVGAFKVAITAKTRIYQESTISSGNESNPDGMSFDDDQEGDFRNDKQDVESPDAREIPG